MARADATEIDAGTAAIKRFESMVPMLNSFASALSGRSVRIKAGASTRTNGSVIEIQVPRALSEARQHDRAKCDQRNEQMQMVCPACNQHEAVTALLFHEISHVAFGSFDPISRKTVKSLKPLKVAIDIERHLERTRGKDHPQDIVRLFHESGPQVGQAFEDIRIDAAMVAARPGLGVVQVGLLYENLVNHTEWSEAEPNTQAIVAPILLAQAPELLDVLHPYVVQSILKPEVRDIIQATINAENVTESTVCAASYIEAMKRYGFFGGSPEEEEGESDGEGTEGDAGDGQPGGGTDAGDSESTDEVSSGEGSGTESEGSTPDSDSADGEPDEGGSAGDGSVPEEGLEGGSDPSTTGEGVPAAAEPEAGVGGTPSDSGSGDDGSSDGSLGSGGDGAGLGGGSVPGDGGESDGEEPGTDAPAEKPADFGSESGDAAAALLESLSGHDEAGDAVYATDAGGRAEAGEDREFARLLDGLLKVAEHFDTPSPTITSVKIKKNTSASSGRKLSIPETILGPATLLMRHALEENRRASFDRNRKSGRVSARVLGRRAWSGDERLFHRKSLPGKRDYAVLIGVDMSGSTAARANRSAGGRRDRSRLDLEIEAAYAQAELCHRMGIKFAVYFHTGTLDELTIHEVKSFDQPWNDAAKVGMTSKRPAQANLDGHTLEFYRKALDKVQATDKVLMYYSDGAMPAENYHEELSILKREIKTCEKKGYILMAVGVNTDDPKEYGMDTVRCDSAQDIPNVVRHLGKRVAAL